MYHIVIIKVLIKVILPLIVLHIIRVKDEVCFTANLTNVRL